MKQMYIYFQNELEELIKDLMFKKITKQLIL